jgi:hypothetical protein
MAFTDLEIESQKGKLPDVAELKSAALGTNWTRPPF